MNHSIPVLKILSGMLAIAAISVAYGQTTSRVSVANGTGVQGNGASQQASISADGRYVVFTSLSTNLAGTTSLNQVFKRDTLLGITTLVSSDSGGSPANADCTNPRVSSDGQYVVFSTAATNMVGGDTNGVKDVFVRDTNPGGGVSRVSLTEFGGEANGASDSGAITNDGNSVVFRSDATDMVTGVSGSQVYVRNIAAGTTVLISRADGVTGAAGNDYSGVQPCITPDGRYVGYSSKASNLLAGDTNGVFDVYVRDTQLNTNRRISLAINGNQGFGDSHSCAISDNGQFVVFVSNQGFVSGDSNGVSDVFLRDVVANTMTRVSVDSLGKQSNGASGGASSIAGWGVRISGNGQKIVFQSTATNLVKSDSNGVEDIFVRDRIAGTTTRVSLNTGGTQANGASSLPTISFSGQFVSFVSGASNLVSGDTNSLLDVFRRG